MAQKQEQELEVQKFLQSRAFKNLITYRDDVLKQDVRSHSYLHGFINLKVEKYRVLDEFIKNLQNSTTMDELKDKLHDFYAGRGKLGDSPYEVLEKGQNLSTRFYSSFGLARSETIKLIDKLAAHLGIGNEVKEEDHFRYEL